MSLSLSRIVPWPVILDNVKKWRSEQSDILRNPKPLTNEDQEKYKAFILEQDTHRFGEKISMSPITLDGEMLAWGGLTNMEWSIKKGEMSRFVHKAELSFIAQTSLLNTDLYDAMFTYFLTEYKRAMLRDGYWKCYRLYSETYDLPHRQRHIGILEANGFKREGVLRGHIFRDNQYFYDVILHAFTKEDYEKSCNMETGASRG